MLAAVFFYSLLSDLATGLGAVPFLFVRTVSRTWLGIGNAVAGGFMAAASLLLLREGGIENVPRTVAGFIAGVLLIWVAKAVIARLNVDVAGAMAQADLKKMLLVVGVMTLHSFTEGIGMGVAFGEGATFGLLIVMSMAIQNIPEGLAISLVLVPRGVSVGKAAWWSIFSSLPQPFTAVLAYAFVDRFGWLLPLGLGFAAGAMLWMVAFELLPEAAAETSRIGTAAVFALSLVIMGVLLVLLGA